MSPPHVPDHPPPCADELLDRPAIRANTLRISGQTESGHMVSEKGGRRWPTSGEQDEQVWTMLNGYCPFWRA